MPSCTNQLKPLRSKDPKPARRRRVTKRKFWNASGTTPKTAHERVAETIRSHLERGVAPWVDQIRADFSQGPLLRPLRHNGIPYTGVNVILLWASAMERGFTNRNWLTFKQALEEDAHVRKGEKGSLVVYANTYTKREKDDTGQDVERDVPFLKAYTVFNAEQVEGLPEKYYAKPPPKFTTANERIEHAEAFIANLKADIRYGGTRAFYSPAHDFIQMPPLEAFIDAEKFYATLAHEAGHWTQPPHRLGIDFGRKKYGDPGYAMGELFAELTAAMLCADLEITPVVPEHHATYIASWIKLLDNHEEAFAAAASNAQRAVDYLARLQPEYQPAEDAEPTEAPEAGLFSPAP